MQYRNPQYNALGSIDCELEHPVHGWIPFTAAPDDAGSAEIYHAIIEAESDIPRCDPIPARQRRQQAINWIDTTADRVRAADRSVGQYLDAEYQVVSLALEAYRAAPDGDMPDAIQSYADAEGVTAAEAAQEIAEAAARAQELLQAVRRIRLEGKAAIRKAGDDADMLEVVQPYIDALEALAVV